VVPIESQLDSNIVETAGQVTGSWNNIPGTFGEPTIVGRLESTRTENRGLCWQAMKGGWENRPLVRAASCCIGESAKASKGVKVCPRIKGLSQMPLEDTAFPNGPRLPRGRRCLQATKHHWKSETTAYRRILTPLWAPLSQIRMRRCNRPQPNPSAKHLG